MVCIFRVLNPNEPRAMLRKSSTIGIGLSSMYDALRKVSTTDIIDDDGKTKNRNILSPNGKKKEDDMLNAATNEVPGCAPRLILSF